MATPCWCGLVQASNVTISVALPRVATLSVQTPAHMLSASCVLCALYSASFTDPTRLMPIFLCIILDPLHAAMHLIVHIPELGRRVVCPPSSPGARKTRKTRRVSLKLTSLDYLRQRTAPYVRTILASAGELVLQLQVCTGQLLSGFTSLHRYCGCVPLHVAQQVVYASGDDDNFVSFLFLVMLHSCFSRARLRRVPRQCRLSGLSAGALLPKYPSMLHHALTSVTAGECVAH